MFTFERILEAMVFAGPRHPEAAQGEATDHKKLYTSGCKSSLEGLQVFDTCLQVHYRNQSESHNKVGKFSLAADQRDLMSKKNACWRPKLRKLDFAQLKKRTPRCKTTSAIQGLQRG